MVSKCQTKIKGLKGHNGIKRRKYRFQETVVMEAEFSSKSGRGISGMDTPSKTLRFYYILALKKNFERRPPTLLPRPRKKIGLCQTKLPLPPWKNYVDKPPAKISIRHVGIF